MNKSDIFRTYFSFLNYIQELKEVTEWKLLPRVKVPADWRDSSFIEYHGNGLSGYYMRCVHTGRYKYVYQPCDMDELYDLETDPWELNNLVLDKSFHDLLLEMKKHLVAWMEKTKDPLRTWLYHSY